MRNAWCGLVLALGVTAIHAQAVEAPVKVIVTVRDTSGAVIPTAKIDVLKVIGPEAPYVQVMRPREEKQVANGHTDPTGEAQLSLLPGTYQISVLSPGFMQFRTSIEVKASGHQSVAVVMQISNLRPDPVVERVEELPLIVSEPLTEMIPEVAARQELRLRPKRWPHRWKPRG